MTTLTIIIISILFICMFAKEVGVVIGILLTLAIAALRVSPIFFIAYVVIEYIVTKI
jgi:hypothetical protein